MFVCRIHCWVEETSPQSLRGCHRETVKQMATPNTTIEAGLVIIAETHVYNVCIVLFVICHQDGDFMLT